MGSSLIFQSAEYQLKNKCNCDLQAGILRQRQRFVKHGKQKNIEIKSSGWIARSGSNSLRSKNLNSVLMMLSFMPPIDEKKSIRSGKTEAVQAPKFGEAVRRGDTTRGHQTTA